MGKPAVAERAGPGLGVIEGGERPASFAGQPPPWSEDAEISVLGAMLIDGEAVPRAVEILGGGDSFYKPQNQVLYRAFLRLHERGSEPDVVTLEEELKATGDLEAVGGMQSLAQLVDAVPTAANIEHHACVVAEKAALRRIQETCRDIVARCFEAGPGEASEVVEHARNEFQGFGVPGALEGVDLVNMADWIDDPDALAPPERIALGVVYRRQLTLLFADPKGGKTTTSVAVSAAISSGTRWMSRPTAQGPVLYIAAEGDRGELLRRLHEFGAEPANIDVVIPGVSPLAELRTLMEARAYRLVVLDTLGKWMAPLDVDRWKQSEVDTVLTPLERIIRESEAGLLALHHANAEGKPIDSTGFAAWADLLRKVEDGEGPRERVVTGRARFDVPDLRFRLQEDGERSRLVSVDPNRDVDERVLDYLEAHRDSSKRAVRENVDARDAKVDRSLDRLEKRGTVAVDRSGRAHKYRIRQDPHGHATDTVGTRSGHGGVEQEGEHRVRAGRGGDYMSPPSPGHGPHDSTRDDGDGAKHCGSCGEPVGPTSDLCGSCKREGKG